jgi:broad specificity phosphatase PhoE
MDVTVEIRRHSLRDSLSEHISLKGEEYARFIGRKLEPFDRVITSTRSRSIETADCMFRAPDQKIAMLGEFPSGTVCQETGGSFDFYHYAKAYAYERAAYHYCNKIAEVWKSIIREHSMLNRILVVSHADIIEAGTIALFNGKFPENQNGNGLDYLEGIRIKCTSFEQFNLELIRLNRAWESL